MYSRVSNHKKIRDKICVCVCVCLWVGGCVCVCTLTFTASVHGDEPSLLPSSGWNSPSFQWDWCECISSSESCSGFYGYQYHADVLRFCRGLRREGGELHGNICGERVWRWGGGTAGGRHRVVAALPSMLSCFLFPAMCAVRWSGVTVCSSHQWLTFTNLRTFSVHIWSTGWNEANSAIRLQVIDK